MARAPWFWISGIWGSNRPEHVREDQTTSVENTSDRRGRPPSLKARATTNDVRIALEKVISEQKTSAERKLANQSHWGDIGHIELEAIRLAQKAIADTTDEAPDAFAARCHDALGKVIQQLRDNPRDKDGYGLGTAYAIQRVLEI